MPPPPGPPSMMPPPPGPPNMMPPGPPPTGPPRQQQPADDDVYGGSGLFSNNWRTTQKRGGYGTSMFGETDEGTNGGGMFADDVAVASGNQKIQQQTLVSNGLFGGDALKEGDSGFNPSKAAASSKNKLNSIFDDEDDDDFEEQKKP